MKKREAPKIDMEKVEAAVKRLSPSAKDWREYPVKPSPIARDAAIRKPLKSHGYKCRGWDHPHFRHYD